MLEKIKKVDCKDILKRAGKTFGQAFIATISVDSLTSITDFSTAKTIILGMAIAGVGAGVSAVWNMVLGLLESEE